MSPLGYEHGGKRGALGKGGRDASPLGKPPRSPRLTLQYHSLAVWERLKWKHL